MLHITYGLGTKYPGALAPVPVIDDYIMPLISELVRDQIALIIITELPKQKAIAVDLAANQPATLQGIQAQTDLDNGVYDIINNIFTEKGTQFTEKQLPGINIVYGNSGYSATEGDNINQQVSNSNYAIGVHFEGIHEQTGDVIKKGDEKAARVTARTLGLLRGILMSGQYKTLGDEFKGIIWKRRVTSLDVLQPDYQEINGRHGIVGLLNMEVKFSEIGPAIDGVQLAATINNIRVKLRTDDDGKVIPINT